MMKKFASYIQTRLQIKLFSPFSIITTSSSKKKEENPGASKCNITLGLGRIKRIIVAIKARSYFHKLKIKRNHNWIIFFSCAKSEIECKGIFEVMAREIFAACSLSINAEVDVRVTI